MHETNLYIFLGALAVIILIGVYFLYIKPAAKSKKKIVILKSDYDTALRSGNKSAALIAGRAYYRELRGGDLSIYDEQAIANDMSTMTINASVH